VIYQNKIVVMDAKPTSKALKHIEQCVAANVCLCGCGQPATRRGLAQRCYYAWWSNKAKLDAVAAAEYDARLIRTGRLLAAGRVRQHRRVTLFSKTAREVG